MFFTLSINSILIIILYKIFIIKKFIYNQNLIYGLYIIMYGFYIFLI